MFEQLWEESPMIQEMRKRYWEQGLQEGKQEGRLKGLQSFLVNVVQTRYPDLTEFVQQQASQCNQPNTLEHLIQQVLTAPDAHTVRRLLESGTKM